MVVKHIANINNNIISVDSNGTLIAPSLKSGVIEHPTGGTGNSGNYIVADGNGGWSWSIGSLNDLTDAITDATSIYLGSNSGLNSTGSYNTAVGAAALYLNTSGVSNVAIGHEAFIGIGQALNYSATAAITQSIAIGKNAGKNALNNNNCIYIGYNALSSSDTADNEIVIGNSTTGSGSNTFTIGNSSTTEFYLPGLQQNATTGDVLTYDGTKIVLSAPTIGNEIQISSGSFTENSVTTNYNYAYINPTQPARVEWTYTTQLNITKYDASLVVDGGIYIKSSSLSPAVIDPSNPQPLEMDLFVEGNSMFVGNTYIGPTGVLTLYSSIKDASGNTLLDSSGIKFESSLYVLNEGSNPVSYSSGLLGEVLVSQGTGKPPIWQSVTSGIFVNQINEPNVETIIGKSVINLSTDFTNAAVFSQINNSNSTDYALTQFESGVTNLNSGQGQHINFRTSNNVKMILTNAGSLGIGVNNPQEKLDVNGSVKLDTLTATRGNFTNGKMPLAIEQNTVSGNPIDWGVWIYKDQGSNGEYGRVRFADGVFIHGRNQGGIEPVLNLRSGTMDGNVYFLNYDTPNTLKAGRFYPQVTTAPSDDRLKHNEIIIDNGLNIIRQLIPQKYQKTKKMKDADFNGELEDGTWKWEAGVIAQDVEKITGLEYLVGQGGFPSQEDIDNGIENIEYPKTVIYNDLFVYNIAATKELDRIVQALNEEIKNLKAEIQILKGT